MLLWLSETLPQPLLRILEVLKQRLLSHWMNIQRRRKITGRKISYRLPTALHILHDVNLCDATVLIDVRLSLRGMRAVAVVRDGRTVRFSRTLEGRRFGVSRVYVLTIILRYRSPSEQSMGAAASAQ